MDNSYEREMFSETWLFLKLKPLCQAFLDLGINASIE